MFLVGKQSVSDGNTDIVIDSKEQKSAQSKIANPLAEDVSQSSRVLASFVKLCSNTALGFELAYPKDWFTTYNDPASQCMYFAPYSFVIPESLQTDSEITPISIKIVPTGEWENTIKLYQNPNELYGVVNSTNMQINGRLTTKVESTSTGAGSLPRGFKRVAYLVFDSKNPAIISYNQLEEKDDISTSQKVLDDMVSSLKFF